MLSEKAPAAVWRESATRRAILPFPPRAPRFTHSRKTARDLGEVVWVRSGAVHFSFSIFVGHVLPLAFLLKWPAPLRRLHMLEFPPAPRPSGHAGSLLY